MRRLVFLVLAACHKNAPPPPPIVARVADLPAHASGTCANQVIAVVAGHASALDESLGAGDALVVLSHPEVDIAGQGTVVIASGTSICDVTPMPSKTVVRASAGREVTWAGGRMRAHLDGEDPNVVGFYFGRIEGDAPIAEHVHEDSWEVLCVTAGSGTFTIAGASHRADGRTCFTVPPKTKHAFSPDSGRYEAIQIFEPRGPEQHYGR